MRKVLLISYVFPPLATSGAIRPLKFTKYLPKFGWQPIVLTVRKGDYWVIDSSLLDEVPETATVYRTHSWELVNMREAKRAYDKVIHHKEGSRIKKVFFKFLRYAYLHLLIPDSKIGWLPFAVISGQKIIREEGIDIIIATGGPWTNFLVGYLLSYFTHIPLILDYRDPWTHILHYRTKRLKRVLESRLENRIQRRASRIIAISSVLTAKLQTAYPYQDRDKFITITNGFDPEDFHNLTSPPPIGHSTFTITYTGSFSGTRVPDFFLQGLQAWLQDQPGIRTRIKVNFFGAMGEEYLQMISSMGLWDVIEYCGQVPHREAVQAQANSHLLLLILELDPDVEKEALTAKIFEYLAARRPILALVHPDGLAAQLIRETRTGIVVAPRDVQGIRNALDKMYRAYCEGTIPYDPDDTVIAQYAYPNLARRLADVLNEVVSDKVPVGK